MATPYDQFATGGIHIKKANRGKFTAAAKRAGMGVQAYAKKVLSDPNASPTLKKRANFARNASKWKHAYGGIEVEGGEVMQTPSGMMAQVSGPSHENGGVDVNVPDGTKIYSDRLKIDGETMQERKKTRERTMAKLTKLMDQKPTDRLLKNTHDRKKFQTEIEESQDMKLQNTMNAIYNNQPTEEDMMLEADGVEEMQPEFAYGGKTKYAYGDDGTGGNPYADYMMQTYPELLDNEGAGNRVPFRPGVSRVSPNPMTMASPLAPNINIPVNKTIPGSTYQAPEKGDDPTQLTAGDYIGLAGNAFNAIAPIINTRNNRRATKPNINRYRGFGQKAIDTNQSAVDALETAKAEALRDVETSVGSSRLANRGSARGINTQRGLDAATTLGANKARASARLGFVNSVSGLLGERGRLQNLQDQMEMQGQTAADQANAMDTDNYYSEMADNLVNLGTNVQGIGRAVNQGKRRKEDIRYLNELSPYGYKVS